MLCTVQCTQESLLTWSRSSARPRSNTPSSHTALPGAGVGGGAAPSGFHLAWDPVGETVSEGANHNNSDKLNKHL